MADLPGFDDLNRRHERDFLIGITGTHTPAAGPRASHIEFVHNHASPGDPNTVVENRHDHGGVHRMEGAVPGVAGHERVALVNIVAEDLDYFLNHNIQRGGLTDDEHPGVETLAVRGQDRDIEVTGFIN